MQVFFITYSIFNENCNQNNYYQFTQVIVKDVLSFQIKQSQNQEYLLPLNHNFQYCFPNYCNDRFKQIKYYRLYFHEYFTIMKTGIHIFHHSVFGSYHHIPQRNDYSKIKHIHFICNYLIMQDYKSNHNHFKIRRTRNLN